MTKKHYEAIAKIFRSQLRSADNHTRKEHRTIERYTTESTAKEIADYFATDNPKFNRLRFLKDCGVLHDCEGCGSTGLGYKGFCNSCTGGDEITTSEKHRGARYIDCAVSDQDECNACGWIKDDQRAGRNK